MTHAPQPKPLPPLEAKHAPAGKGNAPKRKGEMFRQHADFVTQWHRVLRSRDAVSVWHYLWDIAYRDGRMQHAGVDTIAARTGVHERSVKRCVKLLESHGVLEVLRPERIGRGNACGYRIPRELPMPKACGKGGTRATL
jgi:hypothetical protein